MLMMELFSEDIIEAGSLFLLYHLSRKECLAVWRNKAMTFFPHLFHRVFFWSWKSVSSTLCNLMDAKITLPFVVSFTDLVSATQLLNLVRDTKTKNKAALFIVLYLVDDIRWHSLWVRCGSYSSQLTVVFSLHRQIPSESHLPQDFSLILSF